MNISLWIRCTLVVCLLGLAAGCPGPIKEDENKPIEKLSEANPPKGAADATNQKTDQKTDDKKQTDNQKTAGRESTAAAADVAAARKRLDELGSKATYRIVPDDVMVAISIEDGSNLTSDDLALFGHLTDLETLEIKNFRDLDDQAAAQLSGLKNLKTLALTNCVIGDPTVDMIVESFPGLTSLDLSSNPNLSSRVMKTICQLSDLERLTLLQDRFDDLSSGNLSKLKNLKVLDLRGNMQVGDMTFETLGELPNLVALKHRSSTVSDFGVELLAESKTLKNLLLQDCDISSDAGPALAGIKTLRELEIFRCIDFGSEGVLALKGMPLTRLQLRGLPAVKDDAMAVFEDLPQLERLYLQELDSVSDEGLVSLANLKELLVLDLWELPQVGDPTVEVLAKLPKLKELSIRGTAVTDACVDTLLAMPALKKLTFTDNGKVTAEGRKKLKAKEGLTVITDK